MEGRQAGWTWTLEVGRELDHTSGVDPGLWPTPWREMTGNLEKEEQGEAGRDMGTEAGETKRGPRGTRTGTQYVRGGASRHIVGW